MLFFNGIQSIAQQQQGGYSDEFTSNVINSIWSKQIDSGLGIEQSSGVLTSSKSTLGTKDLSASLYKDINQTTEKVAVDYSFNSLNGMGRIYLIGTDSTGAKFRWGIGLNDGWSGSNAKPMIYIYESDGTTPNPQTSWDLSDSSSIYLTNSMSTGHMEVTFITTTKIYVNFTFSSATDGSTSKTGTFDLAGSIGRVYLTFNYPPSLYYVNGECYMFDNYAENDLVVPSAMSNTCSENAQDQVTINGIVGGNIASSNSSNGLWLILFSIGSIVTIVSISTVVLKKKSNQKRLFDYKIGDLNSFNGLKPIKNSNRSLLCSYCLEPFSTEDKFCQQCGHLLH